MLLIGAADPTGEGVSAVHLVVNPDNLDNPDKLAYFVRTDRPR